MTTAVAPRIEARRRVFNRRLTSPCTKFRINSSKHNCHLRKLSLLAMLWWRTPLIPALGGKAEFKASLVYRASSRTARATERKICLEKLATTK